MRESSIAQPPLSPPQFPFHGKFEPCSPQPEPTALQKSKSSSVLNPEVNCSSNQLFPPCSQRRKFGGKRFDVKQFVIFRFSCHILFRHGRTGRFHVAGCFTRRRLMPRFLLAGCNVESVHGKWRKLSHLSPGIRRVGRQDERKVLLSILPFRG